MALSFPAKKFPFVKILFRDLSFGPLIFQQTAKKIIAEKMFRAKMWCNAEIFTLSFNLMSYVELLHLRVTQIQVMDGSVPSSTLRLKVNKGQGLRSGILVSINRVLPVQCRQQLKLFCLALVAGQEKVCLISLHFFLCFSSCFSHEPLVRMMEKVLFHHFTMFFIVFDHANACASMHSLVKIHNSHHP